MIIRELRAWGWSDERSWMEYSIPFSVIKKAKKEIGRQASEEFDDKGVHAVDLAKWKERLKIIIDSMDSIAKDPNVDM